jgi:hypothetical protein
MKIPQGGTYSCGFTEPARMKMRITATEARPR